MLDLGLRMNCRRGLQTAAEAPRSRSIPARGQGLCTQVDAPMIRQIRQIRQKPQGGSVPEGRKKVAGGGPSVARGTPGIRPQKKQGAPEGRKKGAAAPLVAFSKEGFSRPSGAECFGGGRNPGGGARASPAPPTRLSGPSGAALAPLAQPKPATSGHGESGRKHRIFCGGNRLARQGSRLHWRQPKEG